MRNRPAFKTTKTNIPAAHPQSSAGTNGMAASLFPHNHTGLPDALKSGVESLSGLTLDDVHVHYNSSKPARLQALAYAQGTDIHVGPGQERHLPHEAWHVVQQKQGRVHATCGENINDDQTLEAEAERVSRFAMVGTQTRSRANDRQQTSSAFKDRLDAGTGTTAIIQRFSDEDVRRKAYELWERKGSPQNQSSEDRLQDYLEAKRLLRAYEIWHNRGGPQNQTQPERESDYLRAAGEIEESHRLMQIVMGRGGELETEIQKRAYSLWEQGGRPQNQTQQQRELDYFTARSRILDSMRLGLSTEEFQYAGLRDHVLNIRDAYLRGDYRAAHNMLFDNTLAQRFGLWVVTLPRRRQIGYAGLSYYNEQDLINKYIPSARSEARAFEDGTINLPVYIPYRNSNQLEAYFDHPALARIAIPIYLEEWMHQLQRKFRRVRGITTEETGAFLSNHTSTFRQHLQNTRPHQSSDMTMNYNEIDILATFDDWGFDINELGTIGTSYPGRRHFWDWRHPNH